MINSERNTKQRLSTNALDLLCVTTARVIITAMYLLPDAIAIYIARICIRLLRICMPRIDNIGKKNLELVFPEKSDVERQKILVSSYEILARNLLTYANAPRLNKVNAAKLIEFGKVTEVSDSIRKKNPDLGLIVTTMHFGEFELALQFLSILERPKSVLARGFGLRRLDRWWNKRREAPGNEIFARRGGYRIMVERLTAGRDVAVLFDQNVKANHAVFADFFGIKAATSKSVGLAALRTGAGIMASALVDRKDGTYLALAAEIPNEIDSVGSSDEKMIRITESIHRQMEEWIRTYPDHWFWIHRRFKTRPPGEKEDKYDESE